MTDPVLENSDSSISRQDAKDQARRRHISWPLAVVAILALAIATLVIAEIVTINRNNDRLDAWASQLFEHPLPDDAHAAGLDRGTRFGLLWGNGNHCDAEAWMEIATDLNMSAIERHYKSLDNAEIRQRLDDRTGRHYIYRIVIRTRIGTAGLDLRCH